jgi:hypothetical protein
MGVVRYNKHDTNTQNIGTWRKKLKYFNNWGGGGRIANWKKLFLWKKKKKNRLSVTGNDVLKLGSFLNKLVYHLSAARQSQDEVRHWKVRATLSF